MKRILEREHRLLQAPVGFTPRALLAVAAVAQLVVALVAPMVEARGERSSRPHVEEAGTRLHHAHAETVCPACTASQIVSTMPVGAALTSEALARRVAPPAQRSPSGSRTRVLDATAPPRAPPSLA